MNELLSSIGSLPMVMKLGAFAGIAVVTHGLVILIRRLAAHMLALKMYVSSFQHRNLAGIALYTAIRRLT